MTECDRPRYTTDAHGGVHTEARSNPDSNWVETRKHFRNALRVHREELLGAALEREHNWRDGDGDLIHRANLEIIRRLRAAADLLVEAPFPFKEGE